MFNAHLHLDRAGTMDASYLDRADHDPSVQTHVSLHRKQALIEALHAGPAYRSEDLHARVSCWLDAMIACNTRRADTLVDVTADGIELSALQTLASLQLERRQEIDLRLGAYSPFGFRDDQPERWRIFEEGAREADFIGAFPEADDHSEYPEHIGFAEHCRRMLQLAADLRKSIHVNVDQRNYPEEDGAEKLVKALREFGPEPFQFGADAEPTVWIVRAISSAVYDDERFQKLTEDLLAFNVGVICCPSATPGMRELHPAPAPTGRSILRVLEWLAAGLHIRLASGNIADLCSSSATANLMDEVFLLSAALRFYDPRVLAPLAAGWPLNDEERALVTQHLQEYDAAIRPPLI